MKASPPNHKQKGSSKLFMTGPEAKGDTVVSVNS